MQFEDVLKRRRGALRTLLFASALVSVGSVPSWAFGVGGGPGAVNAVAVAEYEQAEAAFIAQQTAAYKLPSDAPPVSGSGWQKVLAPVVQYDNDVAANNKAALSELNAGMAAAVKAAGQLFVSWVNSIPDKANFTAAELAASWRQFLFNSGFPGYIVNIVAVPAAATVAISSGNGHLGMYIDSNTPIPGDWGVSGGGAVINGKGYRVTDTTGLLTPGTPGPSFRTTEGGGRIYGSYDASRFLPQGQSLKFYGYFNYNQYYASLSAVPAAAPAVVGNGGSVRGDTNTFGGEAEYRSGTTYLRGFAEYNFGRSSEADSITASNGSFNTSGYGVDATLGNTFVLFNTIGSSASGGMLTKAPPKPTSGGTLVGIDLSGHIGYSEGRTGAFTDTSGFAFGTGETHFGDVGARAELFDFFFANGLLWKPYIAATVDQLFGFSSTMNIPAQATVAGGDLVGLQAAQTFGGAELGINASGLAGWTVDVKGFYKASADTTIAGGAVSLKIPFGYTPTLASRY